MTATGAPSLPADCPYCTARSDIGRAHDPWCPTSTGRTPAFPELQTPLPSVATGARSADPLPPEDLGNRAKVLEAVRSRFIPVLRSGRYVCPLCLCAAVEDGKDSVTASLEINLGRNGNVLIWCHQCCTPIRYDKRAERQVRREILAEVGLTLQDLIAPIRLRAFGPPETTDGVEGR